MQARLEELKLLSLQSEKCSFAPKREFGVESCGALNLRTLDRLLVSCSNDKCIKLWDLETYECIRTIEDHAGQIESINVLENGHLISSTDNMSLKVWNPADGVCLKTIDLTDSAFNVQVLSGNRVACESGYQIQIWNLNDDTCIQTLEGHTDTIECIIVLPDETLVSGSYDKTITSWNLSKNRRIQTFRGHTKAIVALLLLKDGRLASGSLDKTIKIWKMDSGECFKLI